MKEKLDILLKKKGLSATSLARILGIQPSGLSHILSGRNKPSFDLVVKILRDFPEINPDWLLLDSETIFRSNDTPSLENPLFGDDELNVQSSAPGSNDENIEISESNLEKKNDAAHIFVRPQNGHKDVERIVFDCVHQRQALFGREFCDVMDELERHAVGDFSVRATLDGEESNRKKKGDRIAVYECRGVLRRYAAKEVSPCSCGRLHRGFKSSAGHRGRKIVNKCVENVLIRNNNSAQRANIQRVMLLKNCFRQRCAFVENRWANARLTVQIYNTPTPFVKYFCIFFCKKFFVSA